MKTKYVQVKIGDLDEAIEIAKQIPEFDNLYANTEFEKRLKSIKHLILIAYYKNKPVGFKIGYETLPKKLFYSWMGGVLPKFRRVGIAQRLMDAQEEWVKKSNYKRILVKTRNKHSGMINLLKKNGYQELGKLPYEPEAETRILFEKEF